MTPIEGVEGLADNNITTAVDGLLVHAPTIHSAVYEVEAKVGDTSTEFPITPFDHLTDPEQPVAVRVTVPPAQTVVEDAEIEGGAIELIFIWTLFEAELTQVPT